MDTERCWILVFFKDMGYLQRMKDKEVVQKYIFTKSG